MRDDKRSQSRPSPTSVPSPVTKAEPAAAYPIEDVIDELNFVIGERRAQIESIKRERKGPEHLKAVRIEIAKDMIGRTMIARDIVKAAALAKTDAQP